MDRHRAWNIRLKIFWMWQPAIRPGPGVRRDGPANAAALTFVRKINDLTVNPE